MPDASRSVSVCSSLLSDEQREGYLAMSRADYERIREQHADKKGPGLLPLAAARANALAHRLEDLRAAEARDASASRC